jgi:hypothetical protein
VIGALRFLRELIDAPEERAAFDRYSAQASSPIRSSRNAGWNCVFVLPAAAGPFADAQHADELLALTKAHLDAGALYEAEKTADWIRLKASIKARAPRPAVDWAKARAAPG